MALASFLDATRHQLALRNKFVNSTQGGEIVGAVYLCTRAIVVPASLELLKNRSLPVPLQCPADPNHFKNCGSSLVRAYLHLPSTDFHLFFMCEPSQRVRGRTRSPYRPGPKNSLLGMELNYTLIKLRTYGVQSWLHCMVRNNRAKSHINIFAAQLGIRNRKKAAQLD